MIKVTKTKTVTFTLPDDYREKYLEFNFLEPGDEEYEEDIILTDKEFLEGFPSDELFLADGLNIIDWEEDEETEVEKI